MLDLLFRAKSKVNFLWIKLALNLLFVRVGFPKWLLVGSITTTTTVAVAITTTTSLKLSFPFSSVGRRETMVVVASVVGGSVDGLVQSYNMGQFCCHHRRGPPSICIQAHISQTS